MPGRTHDCEKRAAGKTLEQVPSCRYINTGIVVAKPSKAMYVGGIRIYEHRLSSIGSLIKLVCVPVYVCRYDEMLRLVPVIKSYNGGDQARH